MGKKYHYLLWEALLIMACLLSCYSLMGRSTIEGYPDNGIKLASFGPQYGHPFSMQNVFAAYDSLDVLSRDGVTRDRLIPTHKYVRFMPASESEINNLKQIEELNLYPYPLDCEISEGFVGIDNPFLLNGFPQYWGIVGIEFPLDSLNCAFVVESELLLFEDVNHDEQGLGSSTFSHAFSRMTKELLSSCGCFADKDEGNNRYVFPWGYIRYNDTVLGQKGVEGIIVEAFNFWENRSKITNYQGYFEMHEYEFNLPYRFRVKFSRNDFALRHENSNTDLEYVTGTRQSFIVAFSGNEAKYCPVFQAAELLYYGQTVVPQPPLNGFWNACLRVYVFPNSADPNGTAYGVFNREGPCVWVRPYVNVYGYSNDGGEFGSDILYGTTIHELGHAIHYGLDIDLYDDIEQRVRESFACGIERYFTFPRYPDYAIYINTTDLYTDIIHDLCDGLKHVVCTNHYNHTTQTTSHYLDEYDDDIGSTYTITSVIEAVRTCTSPQAWKSRLYFHTWPHAPGEELLNAFSFWFDLSY